ncbi:hypothetical protein ANO14919_144520 [Xylariales sp. No.14919]|nr:hypothetical protein ANO14919_144520 [Xylariales sp. No.14919]
MVKALAPLSRPGFLPSSYIVGSMIVCSRTAILRGRTDGREVETRERAEAIKEDANTYLPFMA